LDQLLLPEDDLRRKTVPLVNPLSEEWEILPTTLIPGLLNSIANNQRNQEKNCRFFEISKAFTRNDKVAGERISGVTEEEILYVALSGDWKDSSWASEEKSLQFYHLKGLLENLIVGLKLPADIVPHSKEAFLHPVESADIVLRKGNAFEKIGCLGVLHPQVKANFDLKGSVLVAEISLTKILSRAFALKPFKPFGHFSASSRDLNALVDESMTHAEIVAKISLKSIPLLQEIRLNSIYRGQGVPEGKKALHYSFIFQHLEKTLTDEEVNAAHEKVSKALLSDDRIVFK
jgi:phenylalanyl-tRNA synthetase beta chain